MGLDMYLDRSKVVDGIKIWELNPDEVKQSDPVLHKKLKEYEYTKGGADYTWQSYSGRVGYWRKANHIHKWFVDNVQNYMDDCEEYFVSKEELKKLRETCIKAIVLYNNGEWGELHKLMPLSPIKHDEWYSKALGETIVELEKELNIENNTADYYYSSSW